MAWELGLIFHHQKLGRYASI